MNIIINNNEKKYNQRIINYKKIFKYLQEIKKKQCLISNINKENYHEYLIENGKIILKKQIGSKSKYGVIFLTLLKEYNDYVFATKITPEKIYNLNEIILAIKLSKYTLHNLNPHFLLIYNFLYCNIIEHNNNLPYLIKDNKYYITINELADGNLKEFLENINNPDLIYNAYQQILLSILSFHYFTKGYFHNDCHNKNFLFHKIKPGGYFYYNIFGKDIYIENKGYIWLIWDFGLVKTSEIYKIKRLNDYFRINNIILKMNNNDNKYSLIINFLNNINSIEKLYYNILEGSDKIFFKEYLFKFQNLYLSTYNKSSFIINKKPYIIKDF